MALTKISLSQLDEEILSLLRAAVLANEGFLATIERLKEDGVITQEQHSMIIARSKAQAENYMKHTGLK